nr:MAG TPA: hypothetical protein [Caudoviricetes sp.]
MLGLSTPSHYLITGGVILYSAESNHISSVT